MANMAMGLDILGRGKKLQLLRVGTFHLIGAVLGGGVVGGVLGWFGSLLSLSAWRPWFIVTIAAFALWHSVAPHSLKLGRRCQVPRRLRYTVSVDVTYFVWGILLGSGIVTLIPYSCLLVILGTQLTSGTILGALSGAIFGGVREAMTLLPLLRERTDAGESSDIMQLLPALATIVRHLNTAWIVVATPLLVISSLR